MSNCCTPDGNCHTDADSTGNASGTGNAGNAGNAGNKVTYKVGGVGSAHCQGVVAKAVGGLDEVSAVEVEIGTGLVTVTAAAAPDEALDALIAQTVDEAGYDFAGRTAA
ncbi:heavy-metal-associated domain-containing protein [Streptomyces sp. NPDC047017]|uniref:heavy-metal-associated domain-containing protein n=1 Tax=Streptomyces sp. NPDC047017 TaxID=3155024 RepID=UPI0033C9531D